MIIDLNLLAPIHAFVLVILAGNGCLLCHSLNLLLLLCHHVRTGRFMVFYYCCHVIALEDTKDWVAECAIFKSPSAMIQKRSR